MLEKNMCQSCSMPMDSPDLFGTEKDGSPNSDYCKYCYEKGQFTDPEMTLDKMEKNMMKHMLKEKLPKEVVKRAINRLPFLKRWSSKVTLQQ